MNVWHVVSPPDQVAVVVLGCVRLGTPLSMAQNIDSKWCGCHINLGAVSLRKMQHASLAAGVIQLASRGPFGFGGNRSQELEDVYGVLARSLALDQ
jgi:hypothetical protein